MLLLGWLVASLFLLQTSVVAESSPPIVVIGNGLSSPRGLVFGGDGALYVAEAGTGNNDAGLARIFGDCVTPVGEPRPSAPADLLATSGIADVAVLNNTIYVLQDAAAADRPRGIYTVADGGDYALVLDLSQPEGDIRLSDFSSIESIADGSGLFVLDGATGRLLTVIADGAFTELAVFGADSDIPTSIAAGENGDLFVAFIRRDTLEPGTSYVARLAKGAEQAETVWSGLTAVTDIARDGDGALVALETATTIVEMTPYFASGTGELVRQTADGETTAIATGLNLPFHFAIGPDGAYNVGTQAFNGEAGSGRIVRIANGLDEAVTATDLPAPAVDCSPNTPESGSPVAADEIVVNIVDFAFDQPEIEIPVGTTVTWVNAGAVEHTVVSFDDGDKVWDSNIMEPGTRYSYTFEAPGTFDYVCGLHPQMKARVVVTE
jgi:plastocyanin